jgi:hypothetical protein
MWPKLLPVPDGNMHRDSRKTMINYTVPISAWSKAVGTNELSGIEVPIFNVIGDPVNTSPGIRNSYIC